MSYPRLTSALISAKNPSAEYPPVRVNRGTDFFGVGARAHGVDVHFVFLAHLVEESLPAGAGEGSGY